MTRRVVKYSLFVYIKLYSTQSTSLNGTWEMLLGSSKDLISTYNDTKDKVATTV